MTKEVIYKELSYKIVGLLFESHKILGRYRNEKQCADFFENLLQKNNLIYKREYRFYDQQYEQEKIRCIADFVIDDKIILEFKSKNFVTNEDYYQLQRYLVTLNLRLGIIVNFRDRRLTPKRVINSQYYKKDKFT